MASTWRRLFALAVFLSAFLAMGDGIAPNTQAQETDANQVRGMINQPAQRAIDAGIAYLARVQHDDGSWGSGQNSGNLAVTSLCGLAMMSGGNQPGRGQYGRNVSKAVQFVLSKEDRNQPGYLINHRASSHGPMYEHGFATLFLAEAHGMINEREQRDRLRAALGRAVDLIVRTQNREGGWRYRPVANDADISVTICQIMALRAARNAGIAVPKSVADRCIAYVKDCQDLRGSGGFRYQTHGGPTGFARTAAGVVALFSAGLYDGPEVQKGLKYMMTYKPGGNNQGGGGFFEGDYHTHYYYGHYYAAQAMWIKGGQLWKEWFPAIRDDLLRICQPDGTWADHQNRFDRHYCTAMALIVLQIPNNYLPIFQR
jgi:hypothetical protein